MDEPTPKLGAAAAVAAGLNALVAAGACALVAGVLVPLFVEAIARKNVALPGPTVWVLDATSAIRGMPVIQAAAAIGMIVWLAVLWVGRRRSGVLAASLTLSLVLFTVAVLSLAAVCIPLAQLARG